MSIVQVTGFKVTCDKCGRAVTLYDAWIGRPETVISETMQNAAVGAIARNWKVGVSEIECTDCIAKEIFGEVLLRQPGHPA